MSRMVPLSFFCMVLLVGAASTAAKKDPAANQPGPTASVVDVSAVKDKLVVLHDGKGHYIAVVPFGDTYEHLYYGDGKRFHAQRVSGGSRAGNTQWERIFWEPRVDAAWKGSVGFRDGKYNVQCGSRATEFKTLSADDQAAMLKTATFAQPLWTREAYALARDAKGNYYFVDRMREPEGNKAFRLLVGPRGSLKPMKMTNVVSDSQGDIFSTKKGELRLVLDLAHPVWVAGKAETPLVRLPLDENRVLVYTDLGVYTGERLGTPCDDLF